MESAAIQSVWGWEPALYLFFGGLGAGTFAVAGLIYLVTKGHKKAVAYAMWSASACLVVGLALLLADVEKPLLSMMVWQSFSNFGSWMTIGAWLLAVALIDFVVCAFMLTDRLSGKIDEGVRAKVSLALSVAGVLLGLGVAAYTGILLKSAPGVPFWHSSLLPLLFVFSALDTGAALTSIIMARFDAESEKERRVLETATVVLVLLEAVVLAIFVGSMLDGGNAYYERFASGTMAAAAAGAELLVSGRLALPFWGLVVTVGLVCPFAAAAFALVRKEDGKGLVRKVAIGGSICALIGGCALRFLVLAAGLHVDVVVCQIGQLLI